MSLNNSLKSLQVKYTENKVLRAAINLIPNIGGSLDILISTDISKRNFERYDNFIADLKSQLQNIDESKISQTYLNSEEFYDLFIQTSTLVVKTRLKEKIKVYSKIIVNSLIGDFNESQKPEDILNFIEDLTENDILLIKMITGYLESNPKPKTRSDISFNSSTFHNIFSNYSKEFFYIGLLRLEKQRLIILNTSIGTSVTNYHFSTTPILFQVIDYLKN
jgi:hypothetical protein